MKKLKFLKEQVVTAIHEEQLLAHGGGSGTRDLGLLQSALARPLNKSQYDENASVTSIAAAYAYGIAKNHQFIDGNKRTAFVVMETFLLLNGYELTATDTQCVTIFLELASGNLSEEQLEEWIRNNLIELNN